MVERTLRLFESSDGRRQASVFSRGDFYLYDEHVLIDDDGEVVWSPRDESGLYATAAAAETALRASIAWMRQDGWRALLPPTPSSWTSLQLPHARQALLDVLCEDLAVIDPLQAWAE